MSFKRDGDDSCALNNQRKRRVAELLNEDIEDGEVAQLSNGRYVCKLCSHKPIFDTLNMFYVHKQGKKHQRSIEYNVIQQQELEDLIVKRRHQQLSHVDQQASNNTEYQGCETKEEMTKKKATKRNPYTRKPVLDLTTESSSQEHSPVTMETTSSYQLPGNRQSLPSDKNSLPSNKSLLPGNRVKICSTTNIQVHLSNAHNSGDNSDPGNRLKQIMKNDDEYLRRNDSRKQNFSSVSGSSDDVLVKSNNIGKFLTQNDSQQRKQFYLSRKKQRTETVNENPQIELLQHNVKAPEQTWEYYKDYKGRGPHLSGKTNTTEKEKLRKPDNTPQTSAFSKVQESAKEERAKKFLNAFSSGWKRDRDGTWIKDEEVEFDSDEEPPEIS